MIRILLASLILFLFNSQSLFSQIYLGASGGVMNSSFRGDSPDDAEYSGKLGLSGSLIADFTLSEDITLSIQPGYLQKGTAVAYDIGEYELKDSLTIGIDYISVPVLLKIYSLNGRIFFSSGLDFAYLMNTSLENVNDGASKEINDLVKEFDLSVAFGVGVNIPVGTPLISLELRYMQSLLNISDISSGESGVNIPFRVRTSGIQFLAGILFPIN